MSKRLKVYFPDGMSSYANLFLCDETPDRHDRMEIGGMPYSMEEFAKTRATVVVNDSETMRLLQHYGINARPSTKQVTITISTSAMLRERLKKAGYDRHKTTTAILVEAAEKWLNENGF